MIFLKVLASIIAGLGAIFATLFLLASGVAHGTTDPIERRDAGLTAFWSLVVLAFCAFVIVSLAGCATYEGDGFKNTGKPAPRLCRQVDPRGNEKWFNC